MLVDELADLLLKDQPGIATITTDTDKAAMERLSRNTE